MKEKIGREYHTKRYSTEKTLLPQNNILGLDNSSYFLVVNLLQHQARGSVDLIHMLG